MILEVLIDRVFASATTTSPRLEELRKVVQTVTVNGLIELSSNLDASPEVRARVNGALTNLELALAAPVEVGANEAANRAALAALIERYQGRAVLPGPLAIDAPTPPPGDPI